MIIDIPTRDDLRRSALDLLNMAWEISIEPFRRLDQIDLASFDDDDGSIQEAYRRSTQPSLRNAITLVHQAQELGVKARIAEVSPYLLLAGEPRLWPRGSGSADTPFSEFRTIDASDLVRVHDTVCSQRLPSDFVRRFEEGRRIRNVLVHLGGHKLDADAREVLMLVLETSATLFPERRWASYRLEAEFDGADSVVTGGEWVKAGLVNDFKILTTLLRPRAMRQHFGYDKRRPRLPCLRCLEDELRSSSELHFAQLVDGRVEELFCPVCADTHPLDRRQCRAPGCRSDILWGEGFNLGTCLRCGFQDPEDRRSAYGRKIDPL